MKNNKIHIEQFIDQFKSKFLGFQKEFITKLKEEDYVSTIDDDDLNDPQFYKLSIEPLEKLFTNGYCLYFATMLEKVYPGGWVCLDYRYGHIVYVYERCIYDITGNITKKMKEYKHERVFIPLECLPDEIKKYNQAEERKRETEKEIENKMYNIQKLYKHNLVWNVNNIMSECDLKHRDNITQRMIDYYNS